MEIEEILDKPKILTLSYGNFVSLDYYFKLKDCITNLDNKIINLQEENERLKVKLENKLTPDELVSMLNQELVRQNKDYKSRNEKAIEYIDRRDIEWGSDEHTKLLNILQGKDIEEIPQFKGTLEQLDNLCNIKSKGE